MSAYSDRVIADGASNYWRLNEASGLTAVDVVGGKNGTISGGVTLGQPGALTDGTSAMLFNGTTGKILTAANVALTFPVTVECWCLTQTDGPYPGLWELATGVANGMTCYVSNPTDMGEAGPPISLTTELRAGGVTGYTTAQTPLVVGQWYHVVVVVRGSSTIEMFVNGHLIVSSPVTTPPVTTGYTAPWSISGGNFTSDLFAGLLDDVAIYPRALTPVEISAHYTLGTTGAVPIVNQRDLNTGLYTYLLGVFGLSAATSYVEQVRADGATNHWRLGETSGTVAVDAIGGANGTISGGVTLNQPSALVDGNGAMYFDAANDWVRVPAGTPAIGTGPFTIECWLQSAAPYPGTSPFILETNGGANGAGFGILRPSQTLLAVKIANGTTNLTAQVPFAWDGQWHHVVGVLTRGTPDVLSVYIDGVLGISLSPAANGWNLTSPNALTFSTYSGGETSPDYRYTGLIDDVAIYPRALTANEIAAHYSLGKSGLSGGNDLTTLITRYLATLTGDMTARWKQMEKNAGF